MATLKHSDKELVGCMEQQLLFHLAQYLMMTAKKYTSSVSPNAILWLLLHACRYNPPSKDQHSHYYRIASYTLSQSYHIIRNTARDTNTSENTLINKVCREISF